MIAISLGAGVQSSAMLLLALKGKFGKQPDVAIFADTQWEPKWVYEWLERLKAFVNPFPIVTVTEGDIRKPLYTKSNGERFAPMPFYLRSGLNKAGMGRRQCTGDYKIKPLRRWVRENGGSAEMWIGISTDEAHRMKPSNVGYIENVYPLIEIGFSRLDCENYLLELVGEVPKKSSCIGCPFHGDAYWAELRRESPDEFKQACEYDSSIRNFQSMRSERYIHRSLRPLHSINEFMHETQGRMFFDQFGNECEGMCGL